MMVSDGIEMRFCVLVVRSSSITFCRFPTLDVDRTMTVDDNVRGVFFVMK